MGKAVFLDRDGTIARDAHYCRRPEDFEIFPSTPRAVRLLNESGFKVVVITNQSGLARGYFNENDMARIHTKMEKEIGRQGGRVDAVYFCPHHPDDGCECRKPRTALFLQAARELGIDLTRSFMVGDTQVDMDAGRRAGCRTVLANTRPEPAIIGGADYVAGDLFAAATWIMSQHESIGELNRS